MNYYESLNNAVDRIKSMLSDLKPPNNSVNQEALDNVRDSIDEKEKERFDIDERRHNETQKIAKLSVTVSIIGVIIAVFALIISLYMFRS